MSWWESLLLGLVQGLTEFLPVSSSGHLTIAQSILGIQFQEGDMILFDILVHAATVLSTIVILWKEIDWLFRGTFFTSSWNAEKTYVAKICVSMIPIFVVGMFFKDQVEAIFGEGLLVVGCCLLVTALLLTFAQYAKPRQKQEIGWWDAFIIGVGQACAVLPGLSRSGTTIATGILLGDKKESVAQFSFLMVLAPILGEALLSIKDVFQGEVVSALPVMSMIIGFLAAFCSGCFACKFMIDLVKRGKLVYFAIYCAIIGLVAIGFSI